MSEELEKCTCGKYDGNCPFSPCAFRSRIPDPQMFTFDTSKNPADFDKTISDIGDPIKLSIGEYSEAMGKAIERLIMSYCDEIVYTVGLKEFITLHQHEQADIYFHIRAIQNIIYARTAIKAKK